MTIRIVVTRSPTHDKNKDGNDTENAAPVIISSSEEIPSPFTKKVPDGDGGFGNEKGEVEGIDTEDAQPATATAENSKSGMTAASGTATETPQEFQSDSWANETAKNNAELEEEKKDATLEEEGGKDEDVGAYKKVC